MIQLARMCLTVLAVITLTGCIAYYDRDTDRNFNSAELPPGEGIVFLTMAVEKGNPTYSLYSLRFRNKESGGVGRFMYGTSLLTGGRQNLEWDNANDRGMVRAITLPAGGYEIYNYSIFYGQATFEAREEFSISFTVEPGKATYLGSVKLVPVRGRNIFGVPMAAGGTLEISSNPSRDIALFRNKFPNISPDLIQSRPMRSGDVPEELIAFR